MNSVIEHLVCTLTYSLNAILTCKFLSLLMFCFDNVSLPFRIESSSKLNINFFSASMYRMNDFSLLFLGLSNAGMKIVLSKKKL